MSYKEQIDRAGQDIRRRLIDSNPLLTPGELGSLIPSYRHFQSSESGSLWLRNTFQKPHSAPDKTIFLLSGPSAAGKHLFLRKIAMALGDEVTGLITATTRQPKSGEKEGVHHYFLSEREFKRRILSREFIEYIEQSPGRWYGTPKQSIEKALLNKPRMIISDIEIASGWPKMTEFVAGIENPPRLVKAFLLPQMPARDYFEKWLPRHRLDHKEREARSAWEIRYGPQHADLLLVNPINKEDMIPQIVKELMLHL